MIGRPGIPIRGSYLYIAGGVLGIAAFYFVALPGLPSWAPKIAFSSGVTLSAAIAILVGLRRHRPAYRTPWLLIAASQFVYLAADLTFYTYRYALDDGRYPAPADALYLARYPFFVVGILLIARRRNAGANRASMVDALIISSGAMLLSWVFLMSPYLGADASYLARATSLAFPAMDIGVFLVALRLFVGGSRRVPAFYFLSGSIVFLLFSDATYGWMQLAGVYSPSNFLDATWMCSHLCLGAAALHPSMRTIAEPAQSRDGDRAGLLRILPLTGAALIGPVTLAVSSFAGYDPGLVGDVAIAITCAFVFLLVIFRLLDVMASQQRARVAVERQGEELREVLEALRQTEQERARLFDEVVKAAEDERVRVAGELHDGPIQQLTALALTLDLANIHRDRNDVPAMKDALAKARQNASDQMLALRRLMIELRPPALDEIGLEAALHDYTADFDRRGGARCDFVGELGERRLGASVETTLYRVAQEALTNVDKHARAGTVRVLLTCESDWVRLHVEDDGVGFEQTPSSELIKNGHFGIVGMRERVERAGGAWSSSGAPGGGTLIEIVLPLAAAPTSAPTVRPPIEVRAA